MLNGIDVFSSLQMKVVRENAVACSKQQPCGGCTYSQLNACRQKKTAYKEQCLCIRMALTALGGHHSSQQRRQILQEDPSLPDLTTFEAVGVVKKQPNIVVRLEIM